MAVDLDLNKLHPGLRAAVALLPAIIVLIPFYFFIYSPKSTEVKNLEGVIKKLDGDIETAKKDSDRLPGIELKLAKSKAQYDEIKRQLPEENEVSNLLKEVSDNAIASGLKIILWAPQVKTTHSSNVLYVVPIKMDMKGSYHNLGDFLSKLTAFNRIVNISQIGLRSPSLSKGEVSLSISISASTFTAIPAPVSEAGVTKGGAGGKK
jgi:type IV pilus assembly protein PilO